MKNKLFTLIELIVVIVVLGVLAAIVLPNISNLKEEGKKTAMTAEVRNVQSSVDMFLLKNNGAYPIEGEVPEVGKPKAIDFAELKPKFLRSSPKGTKSFWVDSYGTVYGAWVSLPENVVVNEAGELSWDEVKDASGYEVFQLRDSQVQSKSSRLLLELVTETTDTNYQGEPNVRYLVAAKDIHGNPTPPVNSLLNGKVIEVGVDKVIKEGIPLSNLPVGSTIVDESQWNYRTGNNYSGEGVSEPVIWKVMNTSGHFSSEGILAVSTKSIGTMQLSSSQTGRWSGSYLRNFLRTDFYNHLSEGFRGNIVPVTTVTDNVLLKDETIFILSLNEMNSPNFNSASTSGTPINYYSDNASRIVTDALGNPTNYWSRTPHNTTSFGNRFINTLGAANGAYSNNYMGVVPVVNLSKDTLVSKAPNAEGHYTVINQ